VRQRRRGPGGSPRPGRACGQVARLDRQLDYLWRVHGVNWGGSVRPGCVGGQVVRLDRQLDYLWRVHGVDYYAGEEAATPDEMAQRGPNRLQRPPRPEEGEQASEADGARALALSLMWKGLCLPV